MDVRNVKDVQSAERKPDRLVVKPSSATAPRQRDVSALASSRMIAKSPEPVEVHVEHARKPGKGTELRTRANDVINVINVASEAADEIGKLAKSIDGIVDQAANHQEAERVGILEKEANELVDEIRRRVSSTAKSGNVDLTESEARLEIEEKLGRTLKALFPEEIQEPFGIRTIEFSPAENILSVRASVAEARQRIDSLRESMTGVKHEVESAVLALDVAALNSESAQTSIRDVDQALKFAGETKQEIASDPEHALRSVGKLEQRALNLLGN